MMEEMREDLPEPTEPATPINWPGRAYAVSIVLIAREPLGRHSDQLTRSRMRSAFNKVNCQSRNHPLRSADLGAPAQFCVYYFLEPTELAFPISWPGDACTIHW